MERCQTHRHLGRNRSHLMMKLVSFNSRKYQAALLCLRWQLRLLVTVPSGGLRTHVSAFMTIGRDMMWPVIDP